MSGNSVYIVVIAVAALVLWRRTRNMYRPIRGSGIRLLLPLLSLAPALALILNPNASAPSWAYALAFGVGVVLSLPLIWTTNYEVRDDNQVYAQKNWGFVVAFVGVLLIRFVLRHELAALEPQARLALFMTLAFGYLIPWRIVSFIKFRRVRRQALASDQALA